MEDQKPPQKGPVMGEQKNLQGLQPANVGQALLMHSHDGSALGGKSLYGPYFIRDSNGKTYKIVVNTSGVLSTVAV